MKAKAVASWAGAIVAAGGAVAMVLGPVQSSVRELIAQEAAAVYEKKSAPQTEKLSSIEHLLRRQDDRAALAECREFRTELPAGPVRERRCRAESDYRWARWAYEDCVLLRGKEQCQEPEPLREP